MYPARSRPGCRAYIVSSPICSPFATVRNPTRISTTRKISTRLSYHSSARTRSPRLHELFGVSNTSGLSGILSGRQEENVIFQVGDIPSLYVMPVGVVPPNPLELLQQPLFAVLLRELQREFDRVIVDTPPARDSADARVIAATCGQAVLVGRNGRTDARAMNLLVERLRRTRADIAGVVLNAY